MAILDRLLVQLGIDAEDLTGGAQDAARSVEASFKGIAAAAAGAAVGAAFMVGMTSALDASSAQARLAAQLDLSTEEAGRAGDVAGDVFSSGFGDSIGTVSDALDAVASNVGGLGAATDAELQQMTKSALALSDVFRFDVTESTQAAGTMIKSGLVADGQEALDLLTATAQKLPPAMRAELPAVATEYTEFFKQLGFTGSDMMGLLAEAAKNPTFQLDKLGDAVKEFSLRLAETDAVAEPLKELGLDVQEIQGLVNKGQGTRAFDMVTQALKNVGDQTERTRLQAALFGGPGEDLGNSLLNISATAAAAKNGLDNVAGSSQEVTDALEATPAQQFAALQREAASALGDVLAPALSTVADFAKEHPGLFRVVIAVLGLLAVALGVAAAATWVMNAALLANPITWVVLALVALVAGIVYLATQTRFFQALWDAVWGGIKTGTTAAVRGVLAVVGWLAALPGRVGGWFGQLVDAAVRQVLRLVNWIRGLPRWITSAVGSLGRLLWNAGADIISGLIDGIWSALGDLWDLLSRVTSWIPDWKGPMSVDMQLLQPSGAAIMQGLVEGIDGGVPDVRRRLTDVTQQIPAAATAGVSRAAASTGGQTVLEMRGDGSRLGDLLLEVLREQVDIKGGDVQLVIGRGGRR